MASGVDAMTLFIRAELKQKVEDWLAANPRHLEYGGLLFGEGARIRMALPLPNIASEDRTTTYLWDRSLAEFFEGFFQMPIIADFHTHPDGKIASEQDLRYCRGMKWGHHIVIADQGKKGFFWQPLTAGGNGNTGNPVKLIVEDGPLEDSWLALAESTGLTDLGHVLVSPDGELLYDKGAVQGLIELDATTFRVWKYLREKENVTWLRKAEVAKDLGLTSYKLKKALDRLGVEI